MTVTITAPLNADEQLRVMVRDLMRINFTEGHGCGNHRRKDCPFAVYLVRHEIMQPK
jgi:hypothetical protein